MRAYLNTDGLLVVEGVEDEAAVPVAFVEDAVVEATLYHRTTGDEIAGVTWPVSLTYRPDSDGDYQGVLPRTVDVVEGQTVNVKFTLSKAGYASEVWDKITFEKWRNATP
jgi:hypothetical protein